MKTNPHQLTITYYTNCTPRNRCMYIKEKKISMLIILHREEEMRPGEILFTQSHNITFFRKGC